MNLLPAVTACRRKEPEDALAGDRLSEANATGSSTTDSLELLFDELGAGLGGSRVSDNLKWLFDIIT